MRTTAGVVEPRVFALGALGALHGNYEPLLCFPNQKLSPGLAKLERIVLALRAPVQVLVESHPFLRIQTHLPFCLRSTLLQ
jgi:hypothetical protein